MARFAWYTNNVVVYLLVGCLLQVGGGHAAPDSVANKAVNQATDKAGSIIDETSENLSALVKNTGSTVMDFGSQTSKSVELALKAGGGVTLAIGKLCTQLFNGLSAAVGLTTGYLAAGAGTVNGYLNGLPVVGVVTGGLNNVATGMSTTYNEVSTNGRQNRNKMFQTLEDQLNQSITGSAGTTDTNTSAATGATAAA